MDKFIWISGSINSGKSTIAKLLSERILNGIGIELDHLSHFDNTLSIEKKTIFIIQDGLDLAKNWANRKRLPILNWPLWGAEAEFMLAYAQQLELEPIIINLVPDIAIVKKNRGERTLTEWELNRIDYMYDKGVNEPRYGFKIDNGCLSQEETLNVVIEILKNECSLNI